MNPPSLFGSPVSPADPFSVPTKLAYLLQEGGQGYTPTDGFHIYTELRTTQAVQAAEDEKIAARYINALTEYINFGASAAAIFGVTLLEAQGEVLHFFREGPRTRESLVKSIQFVFLFTRGAYSQLRGTLDAGWGGLAASLDGGPTVVLRHSNFGSSSAISLAPSANRPAKQLLYGGTKARHLDIHKDSAALLRLSPTSGEWHEMNLNREGLPFADEVPDEGLGERLNESMQAYRRELREATDRIPLTEKSAFSISRPRITAPQRVVASTVRCDLDGFSAIVQRAFDRGQVGEAVKMFLEILRFGDHMLQTTPGAIQLPWAGDCATTILPDTGTVSITSQPRWLEFSMRWQLEFDKGAGELTERTTSFLKQRSARWAAGGCHGDTGLAILAPIAAQGRIFLIAVGWPVCKSLEAQNLGKGDEIVTRQEDYSKLDGAAKTMFRQSRDHNDYWKTKELTSDKLRQAAIEAGKSVKPNPQDYLSRISTISVPPARPYSE